MSLTQAPRKRKTVALIECDATPRHFKLYYQPECNEWYPPGCMYCAYESISRAHDQCGHSHHHRWQRWNITRKVVGRMYSLGIIAGSVWSMGGGCDGCTHSLHWHGKRPYMLGVSRNHWRCLLKMHHIPGEPIAFGMCGKCLPCPDCGSQTLGHNDGCDSH